MKILNCGGVNVRYTDRGTGAPTLVFIHGWACNHSHFEPQASYFARTHRTVSLDQRGFGASDAPEIDYTTERFADDIVLLCTTLELEKPVLIGHSMGGAVALAVAARSPTLASGLVLCDPAVFHPPHLNPVLDDFQQQLGSADYQETARTFVEQALFIETDDPSLKREIIEQMLETPQHVMRSAFASIPRFDSHAAAQALTIPVHCILADSPLVDKERFAAAHSQVTFSRTPGVGHFHQLIAPDEINQHIRVFLDTLSGAPAGQSPGVR